MVVQKFVVLYPLFFVPKMVVVHNLVGHIHSVLLAWILVHIGRPGLLAWILVHIGQILIVHIGHPGLLAWILVVHNLGLLAFHLAFLLVGHNRSVLLAWILGHIGRSVLLAFLLVGSLALPHEICRVVVGSLVGKAAVAGILVDRAVVADILVGILVGVLVADILVDKVAVVDRVDQIAWMIGRELAWSALGEDLLFALLCGALLEFSS